jgi:hypothetical protein
MRLVYIFLLPISLSSFGQDVDKSIIQSPDKNFSLIITTKEIGDSNTEWKYWLSRCTGDTILLTTAILHDMPAPIAYWNKSSTRVIYEEQTYDKEEIRIYDPIARKLIFQTNGFIWGNGMQYFDQTSGTVAFFRRSGPGPEAIGFDLLTLNVETFEIKLIHSVKTSGDPYTGVPEIQTMDGVKREMVLIFETNDLKGTKIEKRKVGY